MNSDHDLIVAENGKIWPMVKMKKTFEKEGTRYRVRFFDPQDMNDLKDLKEIVGCKSVRRWMSDLYGIKHKHLRAWMEEQGEDREFLFAVAGEERVHGFVYIYPSELIGRRLEVSYAKSETAPSGIMGKAIKIACGLVRDFVMDKRPNKKNPPIIIAEIEEKNIPSIKVIEKAGFRQIRKFDEDNNGVWELDWDLV